MTVPESEEPAPPPIKAVARWPWAFAALLTLLAAVAYGWDANTSGVEMYYVAAVRTMSQSWHAFFFGGYDASGGISIDKLPVGFWPQALLVRAFGLHTWCFIAPQVLAGAATVLVVFVAAKRMVGPRTGLLAASVAAALPATAVMSRANAVDVIALLLMTLAAATTTKAIATGRQRTLLLAALWIGLAFQVKMLEAWAIVPGVLLAYLLAAPGAFRSRLRAILVAGAVTVVVSLSYMTAVALVPSADRPYVDASTNDSIYQQVFEYNG
ncbi:MAG TPA: glycosyltransferase family 39 protein, partial [Micromonosporaceae bacterium]